MAVVIAATSLAVFFGALCMISLAVLMDLAKDSLEPMQAFSVLMSAVVGVVAGLATIVVM